MCGRDAGDLIDSILPSSFLIKPVPKHGIRGTKKDLWLFYDGLAFSAKAEVMT